MKKIALFVAFMLAFAVTSCMDDNTYSVSVLMVKSGVDGRNGFVRIVDAGGTCQDTAQYWGSAAFASGQSLVTIEQVGGGSYFACVFIDTDNSSGIATASSVPEEGDLWFNTADNIEVKDDIYITVNEGDWDTYH
ncbi:MAG: hypothetical protein KBA61_10105 [Spirochaetes bacterium]|nr:hypothetical protein [Spirochaetota bacterium]